MLLEDTNISLAFSVADSNHVDADPDADPDPDLDFSL
jgi:hypothetical protein